MPHMDLFGSATVRHPVLYSDADFDEKPLPLAPGDYKDHARRGSQWPLDGHQLEGRDGLSRDRPGHGGAA